MGAAHYLTVALFLLTAVSSPARERIALIIGANRGLASERQLRFAVSDAKRIKEVANELCRFQESRTYLLTSPSVRDIEKTVDELIGRIKEIRAAGKQVEFLFYYSGHGSSDALHINGTSFSHDSLLSILDAMHADLTIAIVDACYSGALAVRKGIILAPPLNIRLVDTLSAQGTIMLTSSSSDQISHESAELGGSVFTHNLISALRGAADYDGSGTVSLSEAYGYARMYTSAATGDRTGTMQQPSYAWNVKGREEIDISWLAQGTGRLVLYGGKPCPHYVIGEPARTIVAHFTPGKKPVALAVPAGRYRIQCVCDNAVASIEADLTWKNTCTLSLGSLREFPRIPFSGKGPLDRVTATHFPAVGCILSAGYPDAGEPLLMPVAGYEMLFGKGIVGLTLGYMRNRLVGDVLIVERSTIRLALSVKWCIFTARSMMIALGVEAGSDLYRQHSIRPDEDRLRAIGYDPLPVEKTAIPFTGLSVTLTPFVAGRIPLHITAGMNDHIAQMHDGYHQFPRPYAGVRTGLYFSRRSVF